MFNKKEIGIILSASIILAFGIRFLSPIKEYLIGLTIIFSIILINVIIKKITGYFLDIETTTKTWETRPWEKKPWSLKLMGFRPSKNIKKPFPLGIFLPLLVTLISYGHLIWLAAITFEVKPYVWKSSRRHGLYSFSNISESHIGLIAASGVLANLLFGIIGYLIGIEEFAKISIYYAFYNLIPIFELDGNKILFGNLVIWVILSALTLIGTLFALTL